MSYAIDIPVVFLESRLVACDPAIAAMHIKTHGSESRGWASRRPSM